MPKFLLPALAALGLAVPLAAQEAADPPLDRYCPAVERQLPRGPDWLCYGTLNEDYSFAFAYPKAVERVPALDASIRREAEAAETWIVEQVRESRDESRTTPPMRYEAAWQIDALLPEVAAASAAISHYTGGAHGGIEYLTVLVDARAGRRIGLGDLFEPGLFESRDLGDRIEGMRAVQRVFCRALTAAVRARRDDPAAEARCPAVERQPVTFLCGENGRIDRFRALLNPTVVGSRAEEPYEIDIPIDARMMAGMHRRYRPAFGLAGEERARIPSRPCR